MKRNDVYSLESKRIGKFYKEPVGDEYIYEQNRRRIYGRYIKGKS